MVGVGVVVGGATVGVRLGAGVWLGGVSVVGICALSGKGVSTVVVCSGAPGDAQAEKKIPINTMTPKIFMLPSLKI
jgi:hypothetical protein